jgi:hypothetical protein
MARCAIARAGRNDCTPPSKRGVDVGEDPMLANPVVDERHRRSPRWLYRCHDHLKFAYVRGHDYIRAADHELWAHASDRMLLCARSGEPLAYQLGSVFYDHHSRQPIYYEAP